MTTVIIESQSSMSACDKLTMDTMINVTAYSKYMARKESDAKTRSSETKSERRFYKKRILELTKQLIKNPTYTNDSSVIAACSAYINACIVHFKFVDLSDTLQMEHFASETSDAVAEDSSSFSTTDANNANAVDLNKLNEIDSTFLSTDTRNVKKISIPEKNVLEQLFMSSETKTQTQPHAKTSDHIPRIVEIDFKDIHFKTKGIKKSKMKHSDEK